MAKKKILLVDDEENFTRIVKLNLESTDKYEVKVENKGAFVLETAKAFKPDLILLDVVMPDKEGSEIAAEMRQDENLNKIPVVFLTALVTKEETGKNCSLISGNPFIAKPVNLNELIHCIETYVKK